MAISGQVYSGKKYSLFLGRQSNASTPVAMGTAQTANGEFVELDVVNVTDIDFAGGLVNDRTLRTGQQVKKLTDHYVSEKGSTKSFNFEWVCSHKQGIQILLELISEDVVSPYGIKGGFEPQVYSHGRDNSSDSTKPQFATIILKNLDSNKAAGQDRTMHSACLTNLSFSMDATANGGRLVATGTFVSGYLVSTASTSVVPSGQETTFVKTIYDCTTKTINGADVVVRSFNMDIAYPMQRVGYQGSNGEPEVYSRAGEITCSGAVTVLYDENSDGFLAEMLTNPTDGGGVGETPIILSDNATVGSGNFAFEILQAVLTGHNLTIEGAEEGMMVELTYEGTAFTNNNLFRVDID
ncbi:MAG: hypothetical protein Tp1111SUR768151_11 [Prokaryotic dsDNA virus sp.]|nr:MAG: hypothetical protein Tp1111SUR768151_11 [Prokaryotic dsDNA virus sp.]|tara:strand:+ start:3688 stop:4746 length:1059 start_codon:yes stop_codon:yes gene_type:complete